VPQLPLRIVIIDGSGWQSSPGKVQLQMARAEAILGIEISVQARVTLHSPVALDHFRRYPWSIFSRPLYSAYEVGIFNSLGASGVLSAVFTGREDGWTGQVLGALIRMSSMSFFENSERPIPGLQAEGVVIDWDVSSRPVLAHELAHVLARSGRHDMNPKSVMGDLLGLQYLPYMGDTLVEPYKSAILRSPYLHPE
jgi:hypothetical protein